VMVKGATCLIEFQVEGAGSRPDARRHSPERVCGSSLVKTPCMPRSQLGRIVAPAAALGWRSQADCRGPLARRAQLMAPPGYHRWLSIPPRRGPPTLKGACRPAPISTPIRAKRPTHA